MNFSRKRHQNKTFLWCFLRTDAEEQSFHRVPPNTVPVTKVCVSVCVSVCQCVCVCVCVVTGGSATIPRRRRPFRLPAIACGQARLESTSRCLIVLRGWNYSFIRLKENQIAAAVRKTQSHYLINCIWLLSNALFVLCVSSRVIHTWRHVSRETACDGLRTGQRRRGRVYMKSLFLFSFDTFTRQITSKIILCSVLTAEISQL